MTEGRLDAPKATRTPQYCHTQSGRLILAIMAGVSAILGILGWLVTPLALISIPILLIAGWIFRSLTITVDEQDLQWWFGSRFNRKREAIAEITSAQVVRTNLLEGWGIHISRYGWLYNVSGYDAVAVTMRSGKRFALGTDEPNELARAINKAMAAT